jgi:hypothetical protein
MFSEVLETRFSNEGGCRFGLPILSFSFLDFRSVFISNDRTANGNEAPSHRLSVLR